MAVPAGARPAQEAAAQEAVSARTGKPRNLVAMRMAATPAVAQPAPMLSASELRAQLQALPESARSAFLKKLSDMLSQDRPFEVRFTFQNSIIVHPVDGWVASNTPIQVIKQVCQSDTLASAVVMRVIDAAQAEERAHLLGMSPRELDGFLWDLAGAIVRRR